MAERPTAGDLKARGATGAIVSCRFCRHGAKLTFAQLRIDDDEIFVDSLARRRLRCSACHADKVGFTVDWGPPPAGGLL